MITTDTIVKVVYDLYVDGKQQGEEELMERATEQHPLVYLHGRGTMLNLFEQNLEGKQQGDNFDFRIEAKDAYGEYNDEALLTLSKEMFCIDGIFDEERVYVGNIVPMTTADGQIVNAQVAEITESTVTIDLNHPLAGENLHFKGRVLEVRNATQEEIDAMTHKCCGGCHSGDCQKDDCQSGNCNSGCGNGCKGC